MNEVRLKGIWLPDRGAVVSLNVTGYISSISDKTPISKYVFEQFKMY